MHLRPLVSLTLVSLLAAPLALAQQPASPPSPSTARQFSRHDLHDSFRIAPPGMWWKYPDLIAKLNLTATQQKRIDDIFQRSRLELIDLKATLEKQEVILQPMLAANPPDTNKVLAQIDRIAHARADLERANARMLLGIRRVLTPDQWTKLEAWDNAGRRRMYMMRHRQRMDDGHTPQTPDKPAGTPAPAAKP